jgi:hypothetical protein
MGCGAKYDKIDRDSQIVLLSRLYQQVFDIFIDLSLYHDLPWVGPEVPQGSTEMTKRLSLDHCALIIKC